MLIFGTIGIFVQYVPLSSALIACVRAVIGTIFLAAVMFIVRKRPDMAAIRKNLRYLLPAGVALGFNWIMLFEAYRYTTVAVATLCYYMAPVFVIVLSPVVLKEKLTPGKIVCTLIAVAGAARASGHICAPSLIQRAVAECIDCMPDLEAYDVNRKLLYHGLTEIGYECVKPDGAFYLFVKTPGGDNSVFCEKAKARNLLVVPSEPFGVEGYFRLGYCVSKEMIERALPVFREVFEEMR